jgi:hypothetical protein
MTPPPTPPAPPVTPGGRRIDNQPWGHRYWDGQARDAGQTSVAPPSLQIKGQSL